MKRLSKLTLGFAGGWLLATQPPMMVPMLLVIVAIALYMESQNG
jgi:hypothetical protein